MNDFFANDFHLFIINFIILIVGGVFGFYFKRFHIKYTQFIQRFDKTKELFANILAEIASDPEEAYLYIRRNIEKTDAEFSVITSYLGERKGRKMLNLYKEYRNQKDSETFDPTSIVKIINFHKYSSG